MNHVLFDEKIDGSVHLALGQSYEKVGGENESSIHWDIVKDLRGGGRIELDGKPVQENGRWLL
jgi:aminopeptidase